jgi:hypothetical protein
LRKTVDLHGTQGLVRARDARARARVVREDLPSLEAPIEEYRRNLRAMADIAAAHRVRLVFGTSPSLWRKTMPADEMRSLWMGWLGSDWSTADGYFSTEALARAMELFNQTLLDVCRERGVECIDAASQLPRAGDILYDDVHFTAEGARQLAALLARQLEDRPPFRRRS